MTHISIIGAGNMGQAISSIVTKGGNTVEVFNQSDADKPVTGDVVVLAVPYPAVADVIALGDDVGDSGVGHGPDNDVARDRLVRIRLVEHLDGVAALCDDARDGLAHVPGADDADVCHGVLLQRALPGIPWVMS